MGTHLFNRLKKYFFWIVLLFAFSSSFVLAEEGEGGGEKKEEKKDDKKEKVAKKKEPRKEPKKEGEAASEAKQSHEAGPPPLAPIFVPVSSLVIPVIQNRRFVTSYNISLVIEGKTLEDAEDIRLLLPIIKDAFLTDLYGVFSVVWTPEANVFLRDLKTRLLNVAKKAAGENRIKSVLIQSFDEKYHNVS